MFISGKAAVRRLGLGRESRRLTEKGGSSCVRSAAALRTDRRLGPRVMGGWG